MNGTTIEPNQLIAARIRAEGRTRTYPARSFMFHEGDDSSSVFIVDTGLARIDRTTRSGRIVLLDLAMADRIVGELGVIDYQPRSATVSTITETRVHHVTAQAFRDMLAADNALQAAVLTTIAQRLRMLSTQFVETSIMDAPARIAARLIRLVEIEQSLGRSDVQSDGSVDLKLPISQEELGQWSGLSREGAVKGLSTLRAIDLIETGRKRVHIKNVARLAEQAQLG